MINSRYDVPTELHDTNTDGDVEASDSINTHGTISVIL